MADKSLEIVAATRHLAVPIHEPMVFCSMPFLFIPDLCRGMETRPAWMGIHFSKRPWQSRGIQTEWWYFTGNLQDAKGREFGYQLTFFRQGIIPPGKHPDASSKFLARDIYFAHFAVSEISDGRFHFAQRLSRGAFHEAGLGDKERVAWIKDWECEQTGEHSFRISSKDGKHAIDLILETAKAPVIHGADGISRKAEGEGRASHYYSLTRLKTSGVVTTPDGSFEVTGLTWFDHEWATNQLAPDQTGWDWFSVHFEDGSDLMIFQIRTKDGGRDIHSANIH
jgi:predicted secreted hydrolase